MRTQPFTTADTLSVIGRAGPDLVAAGDGVVYKLAPNGWSAIRLHQTAKAVMGLQGVAALVTIGLVVARAVNILG